MLLPLCNNSAILTSNLNTLDGLQGSTIGQWYLPSGSEAPSGSAINSALTSAFADGAILKIYTPNHDKFTPGIYTYVHFDDTLTMIGVYTTSDNGNFL